MKSSRVYSTILIILFLILGIIGRYTGEAKPTTFHQKGDIHPPALIYFTS